MKYPAHLRLLPPPHKTVYLMLYNVVLFMKLIIFSDNLSIIWQVQFVHIFSNKLLFMYAFLKICTTEFWHIDKMISKRNFISSEQA